jgi:hypothetical protein
VIVRVTDPPDAPPVTWPEMVPFCVPV